VSCGLLAVSRLDSQVRRLNRVGVHNGAPLLWHDQTKVGNYNETIRIPDCTFQRLQDRQRTTIARLPMATGGERTMSHRPISSETSSPDSI
jgi:hypothetical protein